MNWMIASRTHRLGFPVLIGALYLALYLAWLLWATPGIEQRFWTAGLAVIFSGLVVTTLAWRARSAALERGSHHAWTWLCAGLSLWSLADLLRLFLAAFMEDRLSAVIVPAAVWIVGSTCFFTGLLRFPQQLRRPLNRFRLIIEMVITTLAAISLAWMVLLKPLIPTLLMGFPQRVMWVYPAVDLLLLVVLLSLYLINRPGGYPLSLLWLALGLFAFLASDLNQVYLVPSEGASFGNLTNFSWGLGDAFLAGAILGFRRLRQTGPASGPQTFLSRTVSGFQTLLPLVLTIALGWYTIFEWQLRGSPDMFGLWATALLGIALIGRQGILVGEYEFQKYAQLVDSVAEPTFICNQRGHLRLVNPAFTGVTGYQNPSELLGVPLQQLIRPAENVRPMLQAGLKEGWTGEVTLHGYDGKKLPVMLSLRPLPWGSRGREGMSLAGTAHDLSEIKRQQAALQSAYQEIAAAHSELGKMNLLLEQRVEEKTASLSEALAQLEQQNVMLQELDRLKSDFVSLVSHELRAPLTNINAGIELLRLRTRALPDQARNTLDLVQAEIVRLTRFIESILDLSALDAGRVPVYPVPLDLNAVVATIQRQMTHLPAGKRVRWNLPDELPDFLADERALTSVLVHLLDNAIKYAPEGDIVVSAGAEDGLGWIRVTDQGGGIAENDLPLLFTPFFRAHPSDSQTVYGHGLGLYIVHRLVEAMNGKIKAENLPEGGARFTCWLPLVVDEDAGEEHELENLGGG